MIDLFFNISYISCKPVTAFKNRFTIYNCSNLDIKNWTIISDSSRSLKLFFRNTTAVHNIKNWNQIVSFCFSQRNFKICETFAQFNNLLLFHLMEFSLMKAFSFLCHSSGTVFEIFIEFRFIEKWNILFFFYWILLSLETTCYIPKSSPSEPIENSEYTEQRILSSKQECVSAEIGILIKICLRTFTLFTWLEWRKGKDGTSKSIRIVFGKRNLSTHFKIGDCLFLWTCMVIYRWKFHA